MLSDFTVIVDKDGKASQPGVAFGKQPILIKRVGNRALFRCPGSVGWVCIGLRSYHPTSYECVDLENVSEGDGVSFTARVTKIVRSVEPGHRWRKAVAELEPLLEACGTCDGNGSVPSPCLRHAEREECDCATPVRPLVACPDCGDLDG